MSEDRYAALPIIVQQLSPIRKYRSARAILQFRASILFHHLARTPREPLASLLHRATGTSPYHSRRVSAPAAVLAINSSFLVRNEKGRISDSQRLLRCPRLFCREP